MLMKNIIFALKKGKGMSTALKILFGALLMVIILGIVVVMANTLFAEGMELTEVLTLENFMPEGGSG